MKGLELPLEVKSGFIGHLQLSIPLRRPKSEPWIIFIEKLYLVAGPLKQTEVNTSLVGVELRLGGGNGQETLGLQNYLVTCKGLSE